MLIVKYSLNVSLRYLVFSKVNCTFYSPATTVGSQLDSALFKSSDIMLSALWRGRGINSHSHPLSPLPYPPPTAHSPLPTPHSPFSTHHSPLTIFGSLTTTPTFLLFPKLTSTGHGKVSCVKQLRYLLFKWFRRLRHRCDSCYTDSCWHSHSAKSALILDSFFLFYCDLVCLVDETSMCALHRVCTYCTCTGVWEVRGPVRVLYSLRNFFLALMNRAVLDRRLMWQNKVFHQLTLKRHA